MQIQGEANLKQMHTHTHRGIKTDDAKIKKNTKEYKIK